MGGICKKEKDIAIQTKKKEKVQAKDRITYILESPLGDNLLVCQGIDKLKILNQKGEILKRMTGEVYLHNQGYCIYPQFSHCGRYLAYRM